MTCLHLTTSAAVMHVENFLNEVQKEKLAQGKLLFMPGPPSVIEESLLCGFVGRDEQTGHPAQKPLAVIEKLILMSTARGELAIDLMSGSGTTGEVCQSNKRYAILCDVSDDYTRIAEKRLGVARIDIPDTVIKQALNTETVLPQRTLDFSDFPQVPIRRRGNGRAQLDLG
jgi:site-specific DNA-methyltransferase (adenine-specific)